LLQTPPVSTNVPRSWTCGWHGTTGNGHNANHKSKIAVTRGESGNDGTFTPALLGAFALARTVLSAFTLAVAGTGRRPDAA
jgi:hypothetical protein